MRKLIVVSLLALAAAPCAIAASAGVRVAPASVARGHSVRIYGSVDGGCARGDAVTLFSHAFRGATRENFAGLPAVYARVGRHGRYSIRVRLSRRVRAGHYDVGGRCGGGLLGHATIHVSK